jgi:hypothetical protein
MPAKRAAPRQLRSKRLTLPAQYRFQVSFDMSVEAAIRHFNAFTYPNLQQEVQRKRFYEPLVAVLASHNGQAVGMVLAEYRRRGTTAFNLDISLPRILAASGIAKSIPPPPPTSPPQASPNSPTGRLAIPI